MAIAGLDGLEIESVFGGLGWIGEEDASRLGQGVPVGGALDAEAWGRCVRAAGSGQALEVRCGTVTVRARRTGQLVLAGGFGERAVQMVAGEVRTVSCDRRAGATGYLSFGMGSELAGALRTGETGPIRVVDLGGVTGEWAVDLRSDRRGLRLGGGVIEGEVSGRERSRPMTVGAIQVTPGGELIVIGPEGPTIGGYATVGVVARVDRGRLWQVWPGERVTFAGVTREEAVGLWNERAGGRV